MSEARLPAPPRAEPEPARIEPKATPAAAPVHPTPASVRPPVPIPQTMPAPQVAIQPTPVASIAAAPKPQHTALPSPASGPPPVTLDPPKLLGTVGIPGGQPLRVRVFVDETGRVRQAMVLPGHGKGAAAEQRAYAAALQARFTPARKGGQACREWTEIPVLIQP